MTLREWDSILSICLSFQPVVEVSNFTYKFSFTYRKVNIKTHINLTFKSKSSHIFFFLDLFTVLIYLPGFFLHKISLHSSFGKRFYDFIHTGLLTYPRTIHLSLTLFWWDLFVLIYPLFNFFSFFGRPMDSSILELHTFKIFYKSSSFITSYLTSDTILLDWHNVYILSWGDFPHLFFHDLTFWNVYWP